MKSASIDLNARKWRFTSAQLLLETAIVAGFLPLLPLFEENYLAMVFASVVLLFLLAYDLRKQLPELPRSTRICFAVSRVAFAYGLALSCSLIQWLVQGSPVSRPPPSQPTTILGLLWSVLSGRLQADIAGAIGHAMDHLGRIALHVFAITLLSSISCVAAYIASRQYRPALWLAALNTPGLVLLLWGILHAIAK
jgi:hypothetical protein